MPFEDIPLNDGTKVCLVPPNLLFPSEHPIPIPAIAFGTGSALYHKDATAYVAQALENGFSHLDTAQVYANEENVGQAIRESGLSRADLYITTKWGAGKADDAIHASLSKLGVNHVDLYLIHQPAVVGGDIEGGWKKLERFKKEGWATSIGVSNFNVEQLQTLVKTAHIKPAVNQIRFHPYNYAEHKSLLEYSAKHSIVTEAYGSLSPITKLPGGPVDAPVAAAAKRIGATSTQVILLWARSKGVVIVTTSSNVARLKEYQDVADLPPLTQDEIDAIDEAGAQGSGSIQWHTRPVLIFLLIVGVLYTLATFRK